jgi:hypothetical protein
LIKIWKFKNKGSFMIKKNFFMVLLILFCSSFSFAQKTEFKIAAGGGVVGDLGLSSFPTDESWVDLTGGAHLFVDVNYFLITVDFKWGLHDMLGSNDDFSYANISEKPAWGLQTIEYGFFLQYPFDYIGGRTALFLGASIRTFTLKDNGKGMPKLERSYDWDTGTYRPVENPDHIPVLEGTSVWIKGGVGNMKSLTDLLYLRYDFILAYNLLPADEFTENKLDFGFDFALGFWIK